MTLAIAIPLTGGPIADAVAPQSLASTQEGVNQQLDKIGTPEWNSDIQKLKEQGRIEETNHSETDTERSTSYRINDPQTGNRVGDFTVVEPKVADRIGGKFDHGTPAIVFNQDDQKALKAGGSAAVGAMAAAWAAALSETVVGSVLSAGAIAFVGGTAAYYLSKNGICSNNRILVVNVKRQAHCE